jgi:hypothetical protein
MILEGFSMIRGSVRGIQQIFSRPNYLQVSRASADILLDLLSNLDAGNLREKISFYVVERSYDAMM